MSETVQVFPVTAWTVGPVPRLGFAVMKFNFITSPMQKIEESNEGPNYALTSAQMRELIEQMQIALDVLDDSGE
ncbi:hypothetical protein [Allopusillimonas ginsengisoli]|uniref:hypothetical protein n=1 Tax=Allopusillimonas ginsengisoli TaxID=453575 RepID=UPI001431461D|nr:hypothetical protein [Allopusillimonas ginsengisoli]